jgi:hypothetical protein
MKTCNIISRSLNIARLSQSNKLHPRFKMCSICVYYFIVLSCCLYILIYKPWKDQRNRMHSCYNRWYTTCIVTCSLTLEFVVLILTHNLSYDICFSWDTYFRGLKTPKKITNLVFNTQKWVRSMSTP